ncbi:hypothetical protein Hanom_Chr17g01542251 [Helianthus anomalus]
MQPFFTIKYNSITSLFKVLKFILLSQLHQYNSKKNTKYTRIYILTYVQTQYYNVIKIKIKVSITMEKEI